MSKKNYFFNLKFTEARNFYTRMEANKNRSFYTNQNLTFAKSSNRNIKFQSSNRR